MSKWQYTSSSDNSKSSDAHVPFLILGCLILILCCIYEYYTEERVDAIESSNPVGSQNPVFNHSSTIQRLQTLAQTHVFLPIYSEATRQHIENFNLQSVEIQSLPSDTILTKSTDSTPQQLPNNNNFNVRRATTIPVEHQTLRSPPSYDDFIRQSSITIPTEQHSFLPPSYDDFMHRDNGTS